MYSDMMMMYTDADNETRMVIQKKVKKEAHRSPPVEMLKDSESKKTSTKDMIHDALQVLHTKKGVSLHAIKKYVTEKYSVDTGKINYLIKKTIKNDLENGNIIQTKGTGVSGSFKLAPKKKIEKPIKEKKPLIEIKPIKVKKVNKETEETEELQKKVKNIVKKKKEPEKIKKNTTKKEKQTKEKKGTDVKKLKKKISKETNVPTKTQATTLKRKSIGSIIKPPKMKPKARDK